MTTNLLLVSLVGTLAVPCAAIKSNFTIGQIGEVGLAGLAGYDCSSPSMIASAATAVGCVCGLSSLATIGVVIVLRRLGKTQEDLANGSGDLIAPEFTSGIEVDQNKPPREVGENERNRHFDDDLDAPANESNGSRRMSPAASLISLSAFSAMIPLSQSTASLNASQMVASDPLGEPAQGTAVVPEPRPPPSSHTVGAAAIDEAFVVREAETNSAGFSAPLLCAAGHRVEKCVTVTCAHPGKRPRKATDLRTLFDGASGHVWTCALCERTDTLRPEQRAMIAASRAVTLTVDGVPVASVVIPNVAVAVYDCIATQLAIADDLLRSRCTCIMPIDFQADGSKGNVCKVPVKIEMSGVS